MAERVAPTLINEFEKDFEPDDPMALAGVFVPADLSSLDEMAACIADEYARMGYGRGEIIELFRNPFFQASHAIWCVRGEAAVTALIDEALARWRVR